LLQALLLGTDYSRRQQLIAPGTQFSGANKLRDPSGSIDLDHNRIG
jgi:hypothetical protein